MSHWLPKLDQRYLSLLDLQAQSGNSKSGKLRKGGSSSVTQNIDSAVMVYAGARNEGGGGDYDYLSALDPVQDK